MPPPERPTLLYDGDCGFCTRWVRRWGRVTGDRVEYAPLQEAGPRFPEIPEERLRESVHLLEPDGRVSRGAEAVFRALAHGSSRVPLGLYRGLPGFARISEAVYAFVAAHRVGFSRASRWLWGVRAEPPTYFLVRRWFLRGLGLVYVVAFASLWTQIDGLIGSGGILPIAAYLDAARDQLGDGGYRLLPTLAWLDASDPTLHLLCGGGVLLGLLVMAGVQPAPVLFLLWAGYLSLTVAGQIFLGYQWDNLLLETGLLAIFVAPARPWPALRSEPAPSWAFLWLLRFLLFRLMFASGVVKLLADDPVWWDLTALSVHYETQPLPTWIGWIAHQLPGWFGRLSVGVMFLIELAVPFCILLPRRLRLFAFFPLVSLQVLIALTGNYGFFNLLSAVLCLPLLDDAALARLYPRRLSPAIPGRPRRPRIRPYLLAPAALALLVAAGAVFTAQMRGQALVPEAAWSLVRWLHPLRSVNGYGLFANMTEERPELVVEGSRDGRTWETYAFRWKPGDPRRRPGFVAPHMPRVDWQMWFEALRVPRGGSWSPWFRSFLSHLLRGSPEVLELLERNPFPDEAPVYLRVRVADYRFTGWAAWRADGTWWTVEERGSYGPVIRRGGR